MAQHKLEPSPRAGDVETVRWLLDSSQTSEIDRLDGARHTPLMYAHLYGHRDCMDLLLSRGVDINREAFETSILVDSIERQRFDWACDLLDVDVLQLVQRP